MELLAAARSLHPRTRNGHFFAAGVIALTSLVATVMLLIRPDPRPVAALPPPQSSTSTSTSTAVVTGPGTSASKARKPTTPFACSAAKAVGGGKAPTRICVPDIRVDASVMKLGLNRDRTVEVPPLSRVGDAGWYNQSAAPGDVGPTVVLGHVDSARYGEGVFFELSRLHRTDRVLVTRGDGQVATYVVDRVEQVSKARFPSQEVYGSTSGPALRLVTCGGRYDADGGRYLDNVIVYGTLRSLNRG